MSRQKRLNAVATTALVAAFPVFPLFADEPTPATDAASQAVASEVAPVEETLAPPDVNSAFADFNVSLFEIPDDESAEFYRKRADDIEREWNRLAQLFGDKQEEFARKTKPNVAFNEAEKIDYAPIGTIPSGGRFVPASPDSVPGRRAVALADLYGRLADAPELSFEVRGLYYQNWLRALRGPLEGKSAVEKRDFYAKILAAEEAKSPLDLGRVFALRAIVGQYDVYVKEEAKPRQDFELQKPNDRADVEKLLDVPEGKSADYYLTHLSALNYALSIARQEKDETLQTRVREAVDLAQKRRSEALKTEAAAFDRTVAEKLLDVPKGETAAFYLARYEETQDVERQLSKFAQHREPRDLDALMRRLRAETLPEIAKRLAYADDLAPLERFAWLRRWLRFLDVEQLQAALDAEIARDATSEIDRLREPCVRKTLAEKRIDEAVAATRQTLPPSERGLFDSSSFPPVDEETRAKFYVAFDEIAELADDGVIPWTLGTTWASWAHEVAAGLRHQVERELATRLYKDIRDALADSDAETDRPVLRALEREIRADEIIGSEIPLEGRELDGTPFNWASYRGAPVLVELKQLDENGLPIDRRSPLPFSPQLWKKYEEAGVRRLTYLTAATLDAARKFKERNEKSGSLYAEPLVCPTPKVAPTDDWPFQRGFVWTNGCFLFDAEGRVLATSPSLPKGGGKSPEIADELRRLFPDVSVD